jgi:TRAP-type mannitol/chloroaromatic compound transport system substrate-binding protein
VVLAVLTLLVTGACAPESQEREPAETPAEEPAETPAEESAEVIKWVAQQTYPGGSPEAVKVIEHISEPVKAMSNGRLEIEWHNSGELVPNTEMYDAVVKGMLDMAANSPAYWRSEHPVCDIEYGLPFGPRDMHDLIAVHLDYGFLDLLRDSYREWGLYYVSPVLEGHLALFSVKPIRTLDDFEGMKIRTIGTFAEVAELLGASTTYVPSGEIYLSLQTGVFDAASWGGVVTGAGLGLHEVTDYVLDPFMNDAHMACSNVVNLDSWNALPDDLKAIVSEACWNRNWQHIQRYYTVPRDLRRQLQEEAGIEFTALSEQDEAKATSIAMAVWDDLANKSPAAAEAIEMHRQLLRDRGQLE